MRDRLRSRNEVWIELAIAGFALASLLTAQLMLSNAIHGTTYRGPDAGTGDRPFDGIALTCFALACYIMARSFDLPVVASALAAQPCIGVICPNAIYR